MKSSRKYWGLWRKHFAVGLEWPRGEEWKCFWINRWMPYENGRRVLSIHIPGIYIRIGRIGR